MDSPVLVPWVFRARLMVVVLIIGFVQSYKAIKKHYNQEMIQNRILVNKIPLGTNGIGVSEEIVIYFIKQRGIHNGKDQMCNCRFW